MDDTWRPISNLAWLWVIEYFASLQEIDPSFLHGLIDEAPELPEDLGKDTREMVALRCMEHLFGSRNNAESNVLSAAEPKVTFDVSNSCEDVLLSILKETSISDLRNGPDLLKWDMQPLIVHKNTFRPKCSLERLKDALLEGTHPCAASLIEPSGLMHKDEGNDKISNVVMPQEGNTISLPLENKYGSFDDNSHHRNLLPMKRNGNVLDNENEADYPNDQGDVSDDDLHLNAKRFKCNASGANETMEQILSPRLDDGHVEESFKRMTETTETLQTERESQVEGLGKCASSENVHEKIFAADRIVRSANADCIYEIKQNQCDSADDGTKMQQDDAFGDEPCQDVAGTVNQEEISNDATPGRILQNRRDNSNCGNQQKSPIDVSSGGFPGEISVENSKDSIEGLHEEDTSSDGDEYHHEKVDVAMEKSQFLSSQCTLSHVSLSHCTELNLCVKCSKDGQLLVCNAVGCPMVVHEKCLGCSPKFDNEGNFYCPFCAYSYAISKYMEAKLRAASARKELAKFIHKGRSRSHRKKHHCVQQKWSVEESDQTNERHDTSQENKLEEPIISSKGGNIMQREEETAITHGMSPISPAGNKIEGMVPEHLPARRLDRLEHVSFDPKFNLSNHICRDREILGKETEGEEGIQKEVAGQQSNDFLEKAACAGNSSEGKTTNEKTKEDKVSNYSIRLERKKKLCVSPEKHELIKRKRVPWTVEEEQMLKEGVKNFSSYGERIPWKQILEYGSSVFLGGRSAIDLKDKWRNMERKS